MPALKVLAILAVVFLSSLQPEEAKTRKRKKFYFKPAALPGKFMASGVKGYKSGAEGGNETCPQREKCHCPPSKYICHQKKHKTCNNHQDCPCPMICCESKGITKPSVCIKCRKKYMDPLVAKNEFELYGTPEEMAKPPSTDDAKNSVETDTGALPAPENKNTTEPVTEKPAVTSAPAEAPKESGGEMKTAQEEIREDEEYAAKDPPEAEHHEPEPEKHDEAEHQEAPEKQPDSPSAGAEPTSNSTAPEKSAVQNLNNSSATTK